MEELLEKTKNIKVLYVEDYEEARESTLEILRLFFDNIILGVDGVDGLEKFKNNKIDLVITDINMPRMNGIEMAKAIKNIESDIPILFVSAYKDVDYLKESIKLGAIDYIFKPFDIDQMKEVFEKVVEKLEKIKKADKDIESYIEEVNKSLKDSIESAAIMQQNLVSKEDDLKSFFKDAFVIWKPKDRVGGDIWIFEKIDDDRALLFVLDGVGHGITGGFVAAALRAIEQEVVSICKIDENCFDTKFIMKFMYEKIKDLNKNIQNKIMHLNFDGAVIYFDKKAKTINYTNSNIYMCLIKDNNFIPLQRDKLKQKKECNFSFNTMKLEDDTYLYISTDGLIDQFDKSGKTFGKKRLKEFLLNSDFNSQKENLINIFEDFRKNIEQIDDITFVGIKL